MDKIKQRYQKCKRHIEKHKKIYAILIFALGLIGYTLGSNLNINDELWNFSSSYKMTQGFALYEERNVIITPLFFYIAKVIMKVFGANLFIFRIYNMLIFIILLLVMIKLLEACNLTKKWIVWCMTPIFFLFANIIGGVGANYNVLVMIFFLIGVYNLIKTKDKNINSIFQGIILFLIFFTKQNVAVFYTIALVSYIFTNKISFIEKIKVIAKIGIIAAIPTVIYGIYLYANGNLYPFINYCFLGITEFSSGNFAMTDNMLAKVELSMFIISVVIAIYFLLKNKELDLSKKKILKILTIFSLANMAVTYPIFNLAHITFGSFLSWMLMGYLMYITLSPISKKSEMLKIKKVGNVCVIILILFTLYISIKGTIEYFEEITRDTYPMQYKHAFYGALLSPGTFEKINIIDTYILNKNKEGKKVIIFSVEADLYLVPIGQNYLDFDLPNMGNWGKNGEQRVLSKIKGLENSYVLVTKEERYDQESLKIRNYIKENYKLVEEIEHFEVYDTEK